MPRSTVSQLERIVGRGFVIVDEALLQLHAETRGSDSVRPVAILLPSTDEQVSQLFRLLGREGLGASVRGGGSGLVWGALPHDAVTVISTARMNTPLRIVPEQMNVTAGAGVRIEEIAAGVAAHGFRLCGGMDMPPFATAGGFVARNGDGYGGPLGLADGLLSGIRCVFASGDIVSSSKSGFSGPLDLHGFAVGSEGTLCVVTEATFRLEPAPPREVIVVALFRDVVAATVAGVGLFKTGFLPDSADIIAAEAIRGALAGEAAAAAGAALLVSISGGEQDVEDGAQWVSGVCHDFLAMQALVTENRQRQEIANCWRSAQRQFCSPHGGVLADFSCPLAALPELTGYALGQAREYGVVLSGMVRVASECLWMHGAAKQGEEAKEQAFAARLQEKALALKGSALAAHGVGARRLDLLPSLHREADLDAMRRIDAVFDKHAILSLSLPRARSAERRDIVARRRREEEVRVLKAKTAEITSKASLGALAESVAVPAPEVLGLLVRSARERGIVLSINGFPRGASLDLDTSGLNKVVLSDNTSRVVVAEAGIALNDLATHLAANGLWFPGSPYVDGAIRLGDFLAWETEGGFAPGYGRLFTRVLGLEAVTGRGDVMSWGGMVRMQHTGLRLSELCLGKRNRYAIITAIALRVAVTPATRQCVVASYDNIAAASSFARLALRGGQGSSGHLAPRAVALFNGPPGSGRPGEGVSVVVEFSGTSSSVAGHVNRATVLAAVEGADHITSHEDKACEGLWRRIAERYSPVPDSVNDESLKLVLTTPPDTLGFCLDHISRACSRRGHRCEYVADALAARADVVVPNGVSVAPEILRELDENLTETPARIEVFSPHEGLQEFTQNQGQTPLAEELKQQFDPSGILPSGRLPAIGR
ncbi:MAG TPA: FAD-binding oxidoreductase [Candidatus Latescibacteria bacterium]|nr:FAD-binding oxidoreductase [Candidatus Latescibacterota bacterium]